MFDDVLQDVGYGLRALRSSPGFAITSILSLALGIGANTAIFSLINAIVLKTLPVSQPEQLIELGMKAEDGVTFSNPIWEQVRERQDVFSGAFAYSPIRLNLAVGGEVRNANTSWVSGDFFRTLGVHSILGRTITDADDKRGCAVIGVLSYDFWQREYRGATDVFNRRLTLNSHSVRIVGVAPQGFAGIQVGDAVDVYMPLCGEGTLFRENSALDKRGKWWLWVFARLKPGISVEQAQARMTMFAPQIFADTLPANSPTDEPTHHLNRRFDVRVGANGYSDVRRDYKSALYALMAAVGVVLLIACANVANLLISRTAARQKEIAVRMAIGASRGRLMRQLLTESMLLSSMGAMLGVLFARWASRMLVQFLSTSDSSVALDLSIDLRVLAFTTAVAIVTGMLFGVAPAWQATRLDPQAAMKSNQGRGGLEPKAGFDLGKTLVASQVALSLVLLIGAGLMLKTFAKLATLDTGFDRKEVLLVRVDPRYASVPPERRILLYQELQRRLAAVPGVRSASFADITPVSGSFSNQVVQVDGADAVVWMNSISSGYFATMETPLIAGRDFDGHDIREAPLVAVVNESIARKFFGSAHEAVGRTFRGGGSSVRIVGVVKDTKYRSLRAEGESIAYYPLSQAPPMRWVTFLLRAGGDRTDGAGPAAGLLIPGVKAAIDEVNHDIALQFRTLAGQVDESLVRERLLATLSGFFGLLALVLAVIGLYGVMAYHVARRRNEIGIRMALGAERASVVRMVLGEVSVLLVVGLALGLGVAVVSTRLLGSFLYRMEPNDPSTLVAACVVLAVSMVVAGLVPARRAANLDPMTALREQ